MNHLTLITGNLGKAREFERLLGVDVQAAKVPLTEIQAIDLSTVAEAKARQAYAVIQRPVFVDDSGISFEAWGGLPGALTSWFMDTVGNDGLVAMLSGHANRKATVATVLAYCDGSDVRLFSGSVAGRVAFEPRGANGFGYDAIFIPDGHEVTFAEMSDAEKDAISMRRIAADRLRAYLDGHE